MLFFFYFGTLSERERAVTMLCLYSNVCEFFLFKQIIFELFLFFLYVLEFYFFSCVSYISHFYLYTLYHMMPMI